MGDNDFLRLVNVVEIINYFSVEVGMVFNDGLQIWCVFSVDGNLRVVEIWWWFCGIACINGLTELWLRLLVSI